MDNMEKLLEELRNMEDVDVEVHSDMHEEMDDLVTEEEGDEADTISEEMLGAQALPISSPSIRAASSNPKKKYRKQSRKELLKIYNKYSNRVQMLTVAVCVRNEEGISFVDLSKTCKQIGQIYTVNRRSCHPCDISIIGITTNGKYHTSLYRKGCGKWRLKRFFDDDHMDLWAGKEVYFITRDADEELKEIDRQHVYILDGTLDHRSRPRDGVAYAELFGWKCVKLPFDAIVQMEIADKYRLFRVFEHIANVATDGKFYCPETDEEEEASPSGQANPQAYFEEEPQIEAQDGAEDEAEAQEGAVGGALEGAVGGAIEGIDANDQAIAQAMAQAIAQAMAFAMAQDTSDEDEGHGSSADDE